MNIREILESYKNGDIDENDAERMLRMDYIQMISDHTVFDRSRMIRKDVPEVIYARTKSPKMVAEIVERSEGDVLISRASREHYDAVTKVKDCRYIEAAEMIVIGEPVKRNGMVGILTAGSSDIHAAEESRIMAEFMGCGTIAKYDVGVAGLHRILEPMKEMIERNADCIVVAAGMEGALPSLVASLSTVPVIGVPTSTGYGLGGNGEAALMSMLQTCSPGLTVVNIDNGIGAGAAAAMIARRSK